MSKRRINQQQAMKRLQHAPTNGKLRVLDVGASKESSLALLNYPDDEVLLLNAPGLDADFQVNLETEEFQRLKTKPFDMIIMSHVLEHLSVKHVPAVLKKLYQLSAKNGQLLIKVPAPEWSAAQLTSEQFGPAVLFHIYGAQSDEWQFHKWAYPLPDLRAFVKQAGYTVRQAGRGGYTIVINGKSIPAEENYVVGVKL
jgi:hypothetical protein